MRTLVGAAEPEPTPNNNATLNIVWSAPTNAAAGGQLPIIYDFHVGTTAWPVWSSSFVVVGSQLGS